MDLARRLPPEPLAVATCLAVTITTFLAGGAVLGAAAAIACSTGAHVALSALRGRARRLRAAQLLTALRLLAAELNAGGQPSAAFQAAAEASPHHQTAFEAAAGACRRGDEPQFDDAALAGLAHAWRVATVTGAPVAAVVSRVADDLAGQAEQYRSATSALAGARSSAVLLAGLPVLGLLLGAAMQARPLAVLFGSPSGRLLCLIGIALDALGVLWTERLTTRAERAP